jgi:hypothetical protein
MLPTKHGHGGGWGSGEACVVVVVVGAVELCQLGGLAAIAAEHEHE